MDVAEFQSCALANDVVSGSAITTSGTVIMYALSTADGLNRGESLQTRRGKKILRAKCALSAADVNISRELVTF